MTREEFFAAQFNFSATLSIANMMYADGLITKVKDHQNKKMFIKHYDPPVKLEGVEPIKK